MTNAALRHLTPFLAVALGGCIPQIGSNAPSNTSLPPTTTDSADPAANTSPAYPAEAGPQAAYTPPPAYTPPAQPETPIWRARPVTPNIITEPGTRIYTVKPGDTLSGIAARNNMSVAALKSLNAITDADHIRDGQKLKLSGGSGRYHKVATGETGIAIGRAYGVPWSDIADVNALEPPYVIHQGQKLKLPDAARPLSLAEQGYSTTPAATTATANTTSTQRDAVTADPARARADAFSVNIGDIVSGSEPAVETPSAKTATTAATKLPATPKAASGASATTKVPASTAASTVAGNTTPSPAAPVVAVVRPSFDWPVRGRILRGFGTFGNGQKNDGLNIAAAPDTEIKAASNGEVVYVGKDVAIYGGVILIRHGTDWITAYGHVDKQLVAKGDLVQKGQIIGLSGKAGNASEPQVHFEIRKGRAPVNPIPYLP